MAKNIMNKKNITGRTTQNSFSSNSSSSTSNSSSWNTSNGSSWNTSHVSGKTRRNLQNAERTYQSKYEKSLSGVLGQIENRKKFEYDVNKDALFQNAAKQYQLLGKQAMEDTTANAATLSGGYGNSYATTAGMQAYQAQLDKIASMVPEYYQQARQNYDSETNELYNRANLFSGLESEAYQRWAAERDYAYNKYNDEWQKNAVSHSRQTDVSRQTQSSYDTQTQRSSDTQTTYAPATKKKLTMTSDDYKKNDKARTWLYNNGLGDYITKFDKDDKTGIATFDEWKRYIAGKNEKKNITRYRRYLQSYLLGAAAGK